MKARSLVFVCALAGACGGDKAPREPTAAELEAGHATVTRLKGALVQQLGQAMAQGVPVAIDTCSTAAPSIAAELAQGGVTVGRATRKPRNPGNLARGWQADALAELEAAVAGGQALDGRRFVRALPGGRLAYAEPLVIQPLCLACHGAELAPEVKTALAARYPDDRATGYQVGDLRGVVWAELPRAR